MQKHTSFKLVLTTLVFMILLLPESIFGYYTTSGQNIVSRETGEIVQLRGIGLGGWLLPEGYMWGIRKLDRPRQFEAAIEDLIGKRNARKFWDLYYENFVTREDIVLMKSWGVNTLRVPLLASMIQPREGQPDKPPFVYDQHNLEVLDNFVEWCEELGMGVIWDLHGAPGGQNAENISDSDGRARLWSESSKYWPLTLDLWDTITKRYANKKCIVGYDLLNEPLLTRYPDVDPGMLRELYVLLTDVIRKTDAQGIIFIEGDDWAQDFSTLEPMDWDPQLVMGFHSYPPSRSQNGIQRWDDLRQKYDIPLWHGETGEQNPPWEIYKRSTRFLAEANIGWNWWTHKKFELSRQPWRITRTEGFDQILAYWNGNGAKPSRRQAKKWLFEQALMTNSNECQFLPGMVRSLYPLDPTEHVQQLGVLKVEIVDQPAGLVAEIGYAASLRVRAKGLPVKYQWYRNAVALPDQTEYLLPLNQLPQSQRAGQYSVAVFNEESREMSRTCEVTLLDFTGIKVPELTQIPVIDGQIDQTWSAQPRMTLSNVAVGDTNSEADLSAWFSILWNADTLFLIVQVQDDILNTQASIDYMKDGIEIYLDGDNSKSAFYDDDDFQLRMVLDEPEVTSSIGNDIAGVRSAQQRLDDGYIMELAIPWSGFGNGGVVPDHLGIEVHVNDNDSNTRNAKLSWWTKRDNAYQSPQVFGTVALVKN